MKKLILIFITLLLSVTISKADDVNVLGLIECGTFLSSCNKNDLAVDCQTQTFYAMGVISGQSVQSNTNLSNFNNADNIKYALIKYCKNNPLKDTYDGADYIFMQLQ